MLDFKALEETYSSEIDAEEFYKKLEAIAEYVDQAQCLDEAIDFFIQVNEQLAENPHCYRYLGNIYRLQGKYEQSLSCLQKAIEMSRETPLLFEVLYNQGMLHREHNKLVEAKVCFDDIIKHHPQSARVHYSLSCLLLYEGRYKQGWQKHRWRISVDTHMQQLRDFFQLPEWEGEGGSRVLILPEQGIGDKVMYAAFFATLPKNGHYTIVLSTRLVELFQRSFPTFEIVEGTQENMAQLKREHFDAYCFMGCVPRIVNKMTPTASAFLTSKPYEYRQNANQDHSKKRRVGISWRGGVGVEREKRSIDLQQWTLVLEMTEVFIVNLQYDTQPQEMQQLQSQGIDVNLAPEVDALNDMDAFASLVASCDVVITVDNSTAHLAGALGVPVWILLPHVPNWRWQQEGEQSYWYSSARLFRQNFEKCWDELIRHVVAQLEISVNLDPVSQ